MGAFENLSYLMIEANSSCNLHCITCNRDELVAKGLRKNKNLSVGEFKNILDQLKECPIDTIKFEGISEPMLHPKFDELSEVLRKYFPKAFVIIATNLQYNVIKTPFFRTLPFVDMVYLSIDGGPTNYERQRVGAKWSRLIKTLDQINENTSEKIRQEKLHINFTLTPANYLDLPIMYELKSRYNLASVRINLAQDWNEDQKNPHSFDQKILDFLKLYKKDVKGVGGWEYKDCFWPRSGTIIDVFGDVRQCIINTSQEPLGNIFEKPLKEIFETAPRLVEARSGLAQNCPPESCKNCDYKNFSPLLAEVFGGKFEVNQPRAVHAEL